jgi:hypothetical protein
MEEGGACSSARWKRKGNVGAISWESVKPTGVFCKVCPFRETPFLFCIKHRKHSNHFSAETLKNKNLRVFLRLNLHTHSK